MKKLFLLIWLVLSAPGYSAIALHDAAAGTVAAATNQCAFNYTTTSGADLIAITATAEDTSVSDMTVSSVTFNGDAATLGNAQDSDGSASDKERSEIWYILGPDIGASLAVVVNFTGTVSSSACNAVTYSGVQQSSQPDAVGGSNDLSSPHEFTIVTVADNSLILMAASTNLSANVFAGSDMTELLEQDPTAHQAGLYERIATSAGSYTQGITTTGGTPQEVAFAGVSFKPAVAAANGILQTIIID